MPALVAGIHVLDTARKIKDVDGRYKPDHDGGSNSSIWRGKRADHGLTKEIGMAKLVAEQKPDTPGQRTTHQGSGDLTEQDLKEVSGGDGPPGTAGDGNGRGKLI